MQSATGNPFPTFWSRGEPSDVLDSDYKSQQITTMPGIIPWNAARTRVGLYIRL